MQEIVTKVLEAEKAAEKRIQEARGKAADIRAQADRDVQATLEKARQQAAGGAQEIVDGARDRAEAEREKALRQTEEENRLFFEQNERLIDEAAQAVVHIITTPQWA
jgi:V/A-type H+-transporting ATPase subunit G/H